MAVLRKRLDYGRSLLCGGFMRIELANLEGGKGSFANSYRPEDLNPIDEEVSLRTPAIVSGELRLAGKELFVSGHVEGGVQVECDRCLRPVEVDVSSDYSLEYITGSEYEASQVAELGEDALAVSVFDGDSIDVDEIVREQLLLAVPTRHLCQDDCKGMCPDCGVDWNKGSCNCGSETIDPRWAALKSLKDGKS
jgi:uncharacterized protein